MCSARSASRRSRSASAARRGADRAPARIARRSSRRSARPTRRTASGSRRAREPRSAPPPHYAVVVALAGAAATLDARALRQPSCSRCRLSARRRRGACARSRAEPGQRRGGRAARRRRVTWVGALLGLVIDAPTRAAARARRHPLARHHGRPSRVVRAPARLAGLGDGLRAHAAREDRRSCSRRRRSGCGVAARSSSCSSRARRRRRSARPAASGSQPGESRGAARAASGSPRRRRPHRPPAPSWSRTSSGHYGVALASEPNAVDSARALTGRRGRGCARRGDRRPRHDAVRARVLSHRRAARRRDERHGRGESRCPFASPTPGHANRTSLQSFVALLPALAERRVRRAARVEPDERAGLALAPRGAEPRRLRDPRRRRRRSSSAHAAGTAHSPGARWVESAQTPLPQPAVAVVGARTQRLADPTRRRPSSSSIRRFPRFSISSSTRRRPPVAAHDRGRALHDRPLRQLMARRPRLLRAPR